MTEFLSWYFWNKAAFIITEYIKSTLDMPTEGAHTSQYNKYIEILILANKGAS